MDGALSYVDEQIETIKAQTPSAMELFEPKSIHQARVATRRLKAGLDLLGPLMEPSAVKPVTRAGRRIRRRLGPLRDLDVMIEHLSEYKPAAKLADAVAWVTDRMEKQRRDARLKQYESGKKPAKLIDRLEDWWKLRHALQAMADAFDPLLRQVLHDRFARFREEADLVSGIQVQSEEDVPVDVHRLRIAGKALRYTLELAAADGLGINKGVLKPFKKMQESLGEWHDHVVLTETTLSEFVDADLPLHNPELAADVLDLVKVFVKSANRALLRFKSQWKAGGTALQKTLHERVPLTIDVTAAAEVTESETDRDPPATPEIQPPAAVGGASEATPST